MSRTTAVEAVPAGPPTAPTPAPGGAAGGAGRVVFRLTATKSLRSGALWGYVFAVYVVLQAWAYAGTYPTGAERRALARSFSGAGGINALVGPARALDTVAGYTAWKSVGILAVLGAVWALLLATKLTRGEEDAGRWELLLAGQTTPRRAGAQALAGLGLGLAVLFALTALGTVAVGHTARVDIGVRPSLYFAAAVCAGPAVFMALGALLAQLAATRHQAAAYAGGLLGLCFALRMVADSSPSLSWVAWATPLGWVDELRPLTGSRPFAFLPLVALIAAAAIAAVHLAGVRDLGASVLPARTEARPRTALLGGPVGLALRTGRATLAGWLAGVCAFGLLLGGTAKQGAASVNASASARATLARLGAGGGTVAAYIGLSFLLIGLVMALTAASQVTAGRREEASGHLEHLLVRPLSRTRWMVQRLALSVGVVVVAGVLGGVATWVGVHDQGIGFGTLVEAGLNVVPAAVVVIGVGTLAWGFTPRWATAAAYAVLAWSFLVELLGGLANSNHWVLDTSVFHQVTAAPAVPPDWTSGGVLLVVGVAAAAVGTARFAVRDLAGE